LAQQNDDDWLRPASVVQFANVLSSELDEARAFWARTRRSLAANPEQPEAQFELMSVTLELHSALPSETEPQRLARRGLIESTAEVITDPALRQMILFNLVMGAGRAAQPDHARAWLQHLDPKSETLLGDSHHRISAATVATAASDWQAVLEVLPGSPAVHLHTSCTGLAAALRANALEKLGQLPAAIETLHGEVRGRHVGLAVVTGIVQRMPANWHFCERSLPRAFALEYKELAKHVPVGASTTHYFLASGALFAVLIALAAPLPPAAKILLIVAAGVAIAIAALGVFAAARRRVKIASECVLVRGPILGISYGAHGDAHMDVVIEHDRMPPTRITTVQHLSSRLRAMDLVGCTFDGFWHPEHVEVLPKLTIHVSGDALTDADRPR
jgi:hypothetical protein